MTSVAEIAAARRVAPILARAVKGNPNPQPIKPPPPTKPPTQPKGQG